MQGLQKLVRALILGSLAVAVLLATACSGSTTPVPPEPATAPAERVSPTLEAVSPPAAERGQSVPDGDIGFEHISVEQGLSQGTVSCILQDSKGFMWFGTEDGLNRYDGYSFAVYEHDPDDPHSLGSDAVRAIYEDQSGVFWVGTDGGIDRFDRETGRFTHYENDPDDAHSLIDDAVTSIQRDRDGVLWIGTLGGLDRFDEENERFIHYRLQRFGYGGSRVVRAVYEDRSGVLWIGTMGGLYRFERETEQFIRYQNIAYDPHSLSSNAVRSIYQDRAGVLWVGTAGGGINRFDRASGQFTFYLMDPGDVAGFSYNDVAAMSEDQFGVFWVGTDGGGLYQFDREAERFVAHQTDPHRSFSLSSNYVRSIYQDRQGVLWVGTWDGGVNKFDRARERFVHYQNDPNDLNSLSHNRVLSIFQDRDGVLWIGTDGRGLDRFDREAGQFTHYRNVPGDSTSLSSNYVTSIYQDRAGTLWIGTLGWGLDRFDGEKEGFTHYRNIANDLGSLSGDFVRSIYEDRSGVLWVGTGGAGLNRFDRESGQFVRYQHAYYDPHSLSGDVVTSIYEDRAGVLWVGTFDGGLDSFDRENERFVHYANDSKDPDGLSDNSVLSIYEDRTGVLWVGTDGGLNRFDRARETFAHYQERDGLPSDIILGILEDDGGLLWLSTHKGLSRFDPQTETFRNYGVSDGLEGFEFSLSASHRGLDGEMFFGGVNGFNAFYLDRVEDNPYIPPVVLTLLAQDGEGVDAGQAVESMREITFRWPKNSFEFEFAALSYVQPEKNQYAYMLQGFEDDWHYVGARRFGQYTNLPGGTYILRVKGSNNDGVWNEQGSSLTITVVPPFWQTWWFKGIVALVLVASVLGGYRLRVQSIEGRNRDLEILVKERTGEIERRRQELEALYRADAELHRHLRLDQVLQALVDIAVDILRADKSALMIWDAQRERLVVRVARGYRPATLAEMSFTPGEGSVGRVALTGEVAIVDDARADPRIDKRAAITEPEGIRSFMQVPIIVDGEVFGVFSADYVTPHAFGDDERRLFVALTQRAALAIDTAQLHEQAQELAVMQERSRLARDLHDAVTQTLFSASLIAEALPMLWESDQDEARQLLKEIRRLSRGALAEMRTLLLELRPSALIEASLDDLLRQLGEATTGRAGVPITVTIEGRRELSSEVHIALYRIAQEALNNVVKHAEASQVTVSLRFVPSQVSAPSPGVNGGGVELCVSDDGHGFDLNCVPPDSLGLGIMRERVEAIGAMLEIESAPGQGTRVMVVWNG